jgi:hypothetical protein
MGVKAAEFFKIEFPKQLPGTLPAPGPCEPEYFKGKLRIGLYGLPGEESKVLKNNAGIFPYALLDPAFYKEFSTAGSEESGYGMDEAGLAAA